MTFRPEDASGRQSLARALSRYAARWPEETDPGLFMSLLDDPADPFVRARLDGHFTGSAWLVDRTGRRVLLTHHRKLERWLQLGGHADGDVELARVALREAEEESGLQDLEVEPDPFDVDRHWIPARGDVPGHWHYDVRYVVRAGEDERFVVSEESLDLAWCDIAALAADAATDASMARMARKWLARQAGPAGPAG
ncbi:NUDIX hydrolase [Lysobacter sp. SG-8]|uniref:NUDIX hydrolase n=1 Tax=Marilutibacter penaei TaxID=2759900 RepID=A0A7W3U4P6_9GAMM|nr:NUDIX hydrolase [Lysobacter penaei]MBB1088926.1 NUDIX hydrolase [Lysobacter penaei]